MAFFVEERSSNSKSDVHDGCLALRLIAIGKRTRLSLAEINEFRVKDLLKYAREYAGEEDDTPREATQADIDNFYAN